MRKEKLEELRNYIDELKTIDITKNVDIKNRNFLTVEAYDCYLNNGQMITREKILKNERDGNACIILPITEENNVVLVVQSRPFTKRSVGIELPAGYVEDNENAKEAALRELKEETGYIPEQIELLRSFYQDQGCMSSFNHSFIALGCKKCFRQSLDEGEFIRYFECSYEETLELISLGYIEDANSILTLEVSKQIVKKMMR